MTRSTDQLVEHFFGHESANLVAVLMTGLLGFVVTVFSFR